MKRLELLWRAALALALVSLATLAVHAEEKKKVDLDREPDVIFLPTPQEVVEKMLETAGVKKTDIVYDLGCGDGRIVITAAKKYGCKAKGFDIAKKRIEECKENLGKEKEATQKLVTFKRADIFETDLSEATVVTLYLLPELNVRLVPQLNKLKKGTRIVSHAFDMRGYKPDKEITVKTTDDGERTIYLWTIPLNKEKAKDE
jgi:SAM-dependent methyltransferase